MDDSLSQEDRPVYLVCPPAHFRIGDPPEAGHPNAMSVEGARVYRRDPAGFRERAMRKWERLCAILRSELGAELRVVDPVAGLDDQVFCADASISLVQGEGEAERRTTLLSRFTFEERQAEAALHAETLRSMDPGRELIAAEHNIEGCGDNVYDPARDVFWCGCTPNPSRSRAGEGRSDARAHAQLSEVTGVEAISLEVRPPFFHLDTAMAVLPHGHVLCCRAGLSDAAFERMTARAFEPFGLSAREHLIEVSLEDTRRYGCNVVARGDTVVLPQVSESLLEILRSKGYDPITTDLEEFILSGGGPHCLVNEINERRSPEHAVTL